MEDRLLAAIRTQLLSDESIERFKAKLIRRLRRPAGHGARVRKLEAEVACIVETIAQGMRSPALLEGLQATEAELERLREAAKVVDIEGIMAALPIAVARYRQMVENLGTSPIDIEQAREVIREITDRIPVRPGADGVPIAELSLNEQMPLGQVAVGSIQIGMVAGAGFRSTLLGAG
jgi:chromatin segregation and condensation protein Rec8/ScpA/Scc1 (kleisin family)